MLVPVAGYQGGSFRERLIQMLGAFDPHDTTGPQPSLDDRQPHGHGNAVEQAPERRHPAAGAREFPVDRVAEFAVVFHRAREFPLKGRQAQTGRAWVRGRSWPGTGTTGSGLLTSRSVRTSFAPRSSGSPRAPPAA